MLETRGSPFVFATGCFPTFLTFIRVFLLLDTEHVDPVSISNSVDSSFSSLFIYGVVVFSVILCMMIMIRLLPHHCY